MGFDPALLLGLTGLAAAIFVFFSARRRRAGASLAVAAALDTLCGAESVLLPGGHLTAVIGRALSGKGTRGTPAFVYDFNFYSLLLVGFVIVVPGLLCLLSARGIAQGDLLARRRALLSTLVILAVNVPLAPIQGFAYGLAILALFNLIGLAASRKRFRNAAD